ncbi:Membrane protein involved in the export of O-antigen and teichoic acid [Pseudobutyrivibrio sp. 49]|uniref:lipopolysaccharide biosynthesis protein n=1 Tax=Pseudobutyrivibrio sp. 49 TaxID=1855344 RepID=UPI00088E6921|nr:lipopolysaccharide biosynthesis protein [Pseudobutyrivibrio sp. 49]SDI71717.1 Membrane protein involved in the export of O-antigen and teichoic acid [Pseudobutyrivibrio sp. 49]
MNGKQNNEIKNKTISNLIWRYAERCGAQGISFVISIVLARLLSPSEYGTIALVTVFLSIFQVFVDSGMGSALIQKKDADQLDFSTIFFFNIFMCLVIYGVFYAVAPLIANYYDNSELTAVIRVLGITIIISGVKNVQQAYVSKNLIFKKFFFSTLFGTMLAGVVGIVLAYMGFGVWALVAQQVVNTLVDTIVLWATVKWRPKMMFSFERLKGMFSYGWKLLLSNLLNTVYNDIRQLIIGKVYSGSDLAYYNRGKTFPNFVVNNINTSINSVLFPVMSQVQDDKEKLKNMTRRAIMTSSFIMWPFMFGLMATGKTVFILLLTEKWLPSLPFLYIFCFVSGMQPIHTANLNAIKAQGKSDVFLRLEVIKKTVGILIILGTMNISVFAIGMGSVFYTIFASVVNAFPNKSLLDYSYFEQIKDMIPSFLLSAAMFAIVYFLPLPKFLPLIIVLIIQVIVGAVVYVGGAKLFKMQAAEYAFSTLIKFKDRKKAA